MVGFQYKREYVNEKIKTCLQRALFIARISQKGNLTIRNTSRWKYNLKIMNLHKLKVVACI